MNVSRDAFYLGPWLVEPSINRVSLNGELHILEPRVMAVLQVLAESPGEVCSREVLLERAWPEVAVTDSSLTRAVSEIRKILNPGLEAGESVETIRKVGYRLLLPVNPVPSLTTSGVTTLERPDSQRFWRRSRLLPAALAISAVVFLFFWLSRKNPELGESIPDHGLLGDTALAFCAELGMERFPNLSPDGSRLAYTASLLKGSFSRLYIRNLPNDDAVPLPFEEPAYMPCWSPDGRRLAVVFTKGNGNFLSVIEVDGFRVIAELEVNNPGFWGITWRGENSLLFSDQLSTEKPFQLFQWQLGSGLVETVTQPPASVHGDFFPLVTDDDRLVFFRAGIPSKRLAILVPGEGHLLSKKIGDSKESLVFKDTFFMTGIAGTTDDDRILLSGSLDERGFGIHEVDLLSGERRWLFRSGDLNAAPTISRDGKRLLFERWESNVDIYQISWDEQQKDSNPIGPLHSSNSWETALGLSRQVPKFFYITARTGRRNIQQVDLGRPDSRPQTILSGQYDDLVPSLNGRFLLLRTIREFESGIAIYNIAGNHLAEPNIDARNVVSAAWDFDEKGVFFVEGAENAYELRHWIPGSPVANRVSEHRIANVQSSIGFPGILFVNRPNQSGLWLLDLQDDRLRLLDQQPISSDFGSWQVTEDGIFLLDRAKAPTISLVHLDPETMTRTELTRFHGIVPLLYRNLAVLPQEKKAFVSLRSQLESDIMLVEKVDYLAEPGD